MATLKLLSNAKSPNLIDFDREGIIDDLVTAIKSDPDWNSLWDGELLQNASFMIMNYFAYMAEKGYTQFNRSIRENFLYEAKDPVSVSNILAQRNINLFQNRASIVRVTATIIDGIITDSMLTSDLLGNRYLNVLNGLKILGADQDGAQTIFEAIAMAEDGKPDYKNDVPVLIGQTNRISFEFDAYSGQTEQAIFLLGPEHEKNFFIDLDQTDIIENSIRVYWDYGTPDEIELIETASFSKTIQQFDNQDDSQRWSEFFPFGLPSYIAKFDTNGSCRIYFGNDRFGGSFKNQEGKTLTVFVRTGGGTIANVNAGKIDYTTTLPINSAIDLPIRIVNELSAYGGADRETLSQAKVFSLYRNEDDRIIVKDQDALSLLRAISNKQKVDSPFYSEDNTVPILHSHNFIAPNRNFSDFVFPVVLESDTAESYNAKFLVALNEYLNLQGITDGVVTGEVLTDYVYDAALDTYNTFVKLRDTNPMNGSLVLRAIKYNGNVADEIEFNTKYLSGIIFNTSVRVPARQFSSLPFENVISSFTVPVGSNRIILNFDNSGDIEIELSTVTFVDVNTFASAFNSLIQNALSLTNPTYYNLRTGHVWVYYNETSKTLIFESPTIGYGSSVEIKEPSLDSALGFFGLIESYAIPLLKTENVFLDDTSFEPASGEIYLSIRREAAERESTYDEAEMQAILVQEPSVETGPTLDVFLKDKNNIDTDRIKPDSDILIDFYVENNNVLEINQDFRAKVPLVSEQNNVVVNNFNGEGTLVPPANSILNYDECTFDYETSKLHLAFVDSLGVNNSLPLVPPYAPEFDENVDNVKLTYKYKIDKLEEQTAPDAGLWGGSEAANILTAPAPLNFPLGFQIKDFTDMKITLLDDNDNVVSGTSTLLLNSSNIIGNITFLLSAFPTCYASTLTVTKTGSASDSITFALQNGFNFGTSFASYPLIRKIKKLKFEYITEDQIVETITEVGNPEFFSQDVSQSQGPRLDYILNKNADEISTDVNFLVEAFSGVTLIESFEIPAVLNLIDQNIPSFIVGPGVGPAGWFKNNNSTPDVNFYRITSGPNLNKINISLKVKDSLSIPNAPVPPYLINPLLTQVKKMVITYERKTYEFILADYKQDVYYPNGEAKNFSDILNNAGSKMMGFHHLIRTVNFIPIPIEVTLKIKKGFSNPTASSIAKNLIYDQYGYSNFNYKHNIGEGFSYGDLQTLLNRNDLNQGVANAIVVSPASDIIDDSELKNNYYFVLPEFVVEQLAFLEQTNENILGISELYTINIGAERV